MALSPPCPRPPPHLAEVVPFGPVGGFWPEAEEMQLRCQDLFILGHTGEDEQEPHLLAMSCREQQVGKWSQTGRWGNSAQPPPAAPLSPAPRGTPLTFIQEAADRVALQDIGVLGDTIGVGHGVEQIHHVLGRLLEVSWGGRRVFDAKDFQQPLECLSSPACCAGRARARRPCQHQQQQHGPQHGSAVPAPARFPPCLPSTAFITRWKDGLGSNMHMSNQEGKES